MNILLAEDNEDDVFFLQQALMKAAAEGSFLVVRDGVEALAFLKGDGIYADRTVYPFPDVLLLDLNMPRLNGFEVLEWVRQEPQCRTLMVHVLTASSWEADIHRAYDLGANSYVVKPNRFDELVAFVSSFHQWHRFVSLPRILVGGNPIARAR